MSEQKPLPPAITLTSGLVSDDDRMDYTQAMRYRLISEMTQDGQAMPSDPKEQKVLLTALKDIDQTALTNKRIGSNEKQGAKDREAAMYIAKITGQRYPTPSGNPFEQEVLDGEFREVPALDESGLPMLELAPGETDIGIATRNYDEFMRDTSGKGGQE